MPIAALTSGNQRTFLMDAEMGSGEEKCSVRRVISVTEQTAKLFNAVTASNKRLSSDQGPPSVTICNALLENC